METSKTYLAKNIRTKLLRAEKSSWERAIGDRLNIEGEPYTVVYLTTDYPTALAVIKELNRRRANNNARIRSANKKQEDSLFMKVLLSVAKEAGVDHDDAIKAIKSLV